MNLSEARTLASDLMTKHGVGHVPFEFNGGKRRIGVCFFRSVNGTYQPVKIGISRHYATLLSEAELTNTILHEIAHALAGRDAGHGPHWRAVARSIGCNAQRCSDASARPEASVKGWCRKCEKVVMQQHRLPLRVYWHSGCGKSMDDALVWFKNGQRVSIKDMPARYRSEFNSGTIAGKVKPKTLEDFFKF
jgi:predicted SprT family Zn-dependent metalloprotease